MEFHEIGCLTLDWINLAQHRDKPQDFVNAVIKVRVSQNADNFFTSSGTVSFSRRTTPRNKGFQRNSL